MCERASIDQLIVFACEHDHFSSSPLSVRHQPRSRPYKILHRFELAQIIKYAFCNTILSTLSMQCYNNNAAIDIPQHDIYSIGCGALIEFNFTNVNLLYNFNQHLPHTDTQCFNIHSECACCLFIDVNAAELWFRKGFTCPICIWSWDLYFGI